MNSKWLEIAIEHHQSGRFADAERIYLRILRKSPDDPNALHFLGVLKHQNESHEEAIQLIRESIERRPEYADAHRNLARIYSEVGEHRAAIGHCNEAIRLQPDLADAHFLLGVCQRKEREPINAIASFRRAVELQPENVHSYIHLGEAFNEADLGDDACRSFRRAISVDPTESRAYERLGVILYALGRIDEAAEAYRQWCEVEPSNPRAAHMYASCRGSAAPARASDDYVVSVFDQFADSFNNKLADLKYRAPQLVVDALTEAAGNRRHENVLDAGCGTGLCGPLVRPLANGLDGVDLSPKMIDKAANLDVYDTLTVGELMSFMHEHSGCYDVVVSADTLVYFGDLVPPLEAAYAALRKNGWLIFTIESLDAPDGFALNPHGRYGHSGQYVRKTLERCGFDAVEVRNAELRVENKKAVRGMVITAHR